VKFFVTSGELLDADRVCTLGPVAVSELEVEECRA
jgi:hypothetical protein